MVRLFRRLPVVHLIVIFMDDISPIAKDETEMLFVIDASRDSLAGYTGARAVEKRTESGIKEQKELQR